MRYCTGYALSLLLLFSGCSLRTLALRSTAGLLDTGIAAFYEEPDTRLAREALAAQLKLLEALLKNDPSNAQLLKALCEGFVGYAFLFLEEEAPERAKEFYARGARYGLRLAARNPALRNLEKLPVTDMEAALRLARLKDVPGLYWAATGLAGLANLSKGDPEALAGLPKAARMMEQVQRLAPAYQYGGPDLFFGVYYAARPKIAGGDPEKGKAHFEAAIHLTQGRFLTAQFLYAKYYAVAALDAGLFRKLNDEVLASVPDIFPEARLANEVAKIKSKKLLEQFDELF